jgi:hypothetical protein
MHPKKSVSTAYDADHVDAKSRVGHSRTSDATSTSMWPISVAVRSPGPRSATIAQVHTVATLSLGHRPAPVRTNQIDGGHNVTMTVSPFTVFPQWVC